MEYRRLGTTGIKVSPLCLGTMNFGAKVGESQAIKLIHKAIDHGVNFIDTANVYVRGKSEEIVGKAIKGMRDDIVLATKVRHRMGDGVNDEGLSRKHILHAVEESLSRLGTDFIDIYYVHRPSNATSAGFQGSPVPMLETLSALTDLVRSGKVRYLGCSNFPAWLHCKALWTSDKHQLERYVVSQPRYNLFQREIEREVLPLCEDQGIAVVPYSPLAGGVLSGKYTAGAPPPSDTRGVTGMRWIKSHDFHWETSNNLRVLVGLRDIARDMDIPMAQLALAWLVSRPLITSAIIGASNPEQLTQNLDAVNVKLIDQVVERINQIAPQLGSYIT
ncbi:MAG: aldo/keto reductase [Candidatus Bathyarchaeota archaeon]|nr:aldo/keto reductase [Candidatus Bathyarchaeota archaeon]